MFDRISSKKSTPKQVRVQDTDTDKTSKHSISKNPTPFHRSQSYIPKDPKTKTKPSRFHFKWHIYDNNGSFNGWFDWLPLWMRVGYWSPVFVVALAAFYGGLIWFKPSPLEFAPMVSFKELHTGDDDVLNDAWIMGMPKSTTLDMIIFTWGIIVIIYAKLTLGSIWWLFISFTGWSWSLLTLRAGLEFGAWVTSSILQQNNNDDAFATTLAIWGSSLRFVTVTNACVVCTIWNFILLPIIYFVSMPPGEKRDNFRKFNFGFFMTNIHVLNFPMAIVNNVYGSNVRVFAMSDLWVGYSVIGLYSILYFFVMDRLGMHFYPILCPRTGFCILTIVGLLGLYYYLFLKWNEFISSSLVQ